MESFTAAPPSSQDTRPSILLFHGKIFTAEPGDAAWAEAAAVEGSKFVFVGPLSEAREFCRRHATARDGSVREVAVPAGGLLLPGFIDAHVHPLAAGTKELTADTYCDISKASGLEEALELCRQYAALFLKGKVGEGGSPWVLGGGWRDDWWPDRVPRSCQLDEAFGPDVPVVLRRWDMHACWCSSKALQLAGFDREDGSEGPACPKGGQVVVDGRGRAVGLMYDAAQDLVVRAVPPLSHQMRVQALLLALRRMVSVGITGYLEALVKNHRQLSVYQSVYSDGQASARLLPWASLALQCTDTHHVQQLQEQRGVTGDRLYLHTAKLMVDGVMESRTAALHQPYLQPDHGQHGGQACCSGELHLSPEELREVVTALDRHRLSVHCHCVGDRATTEVLDAIQAASAVNGKWDARHTIAHLQLVRPHDVARFSELGVVANYTPYWLCTNKEMETVIGPSLGPAERAEQQYPIRAMLEAGTRMSFGSDWPVDGVLDPLTGIQVAVTRVAPGSTYAPWLPSQRLTLEQALRAYTIDAAYACHADSHTGSIRVGKDADLVLLDQDLFAIGEESIHRSRVLMTMIRGVVCFSDEKGPVMVAN